MANDPGTGLSGSDHTLVLAAGRLSRALRSMAAISRSDGVALMIDDPEAGLRPVAGSTAEGLELEHPAARESVAADHPVAVAGRERGAATGARAVLAVPVHLGGAVVGALNFYRSTPGSWTSDQIAVGQSLAGIAADLLVRLTVPPPAHDRGGRGAVTAH